MGADHNSRKCVSYISYIGMISHVIDDALQHRWQRDHGVCASAVDGLVWLL